MSYSGKFKPRNIHKYKGDVNNIVYRSSWELRVMKRLDQNSLVLRWNSESVIIPYVSPVDGRKHRYFVDIWCQINHNGTGNIKELLIEIKPFTQTQPPKIRKRKTSKYIKEVKTYGINQAKWSAAEQYAMMNNMQFMILTEKGTLINEEFYPASNRIF